MTDETALLAAIRAAPADDAPRLVYADWLDEHGRPDRAEFIRVQCELARTDDPALRRREAELLATYHDALAGPLAAPHLRYVFRRGFVDGLGHSGLYANARRRSREDSWSYIRFLPRGNQVQIESSFEPLAPADLVWQFSRQSGPVYFATYTLDAMDFPARVHIFPPEDDAARGLQGEFRGSTFYLDGLDPRNNKRARTPYVHRNVPGFDSFPET